MKILLASEQGMCFGVRDALAAIADVANPQQVTIHGELVHNPVVLRDLARRGFAASPESARDIPTTPTVLVTAHGISDRERARLEQAGKQLIDTTCPLVHKAHDAAKALQQEGRRIVVVGKRDHVEVRGIVEDLVEPVVLGTPDEVRTLPEPRLGVVFQTTTADATAANILAALRAANPTADIAVADTICSPTRARQVALRDLLPRVDALVVVGGHDSNNTRRLVRTAEDAGVRALHVEGPDEIDPHWFADAAVVGLTAGTSTLAATVRAVHERLLAIAAGNPRMRAS